MRSLVILALASLLALPSAAGADGHTQAQCATGPSFAGTFATPGGVLENLLFAEGDLWVSAGSEVLRFGPDGQQGAGLTTQLASAGGLVQDVNGVIDPGKQGWIYAGSANGIVGAFGDGQGKVLRFDPADPDGTVEEFSSGFSMANGMWLGEDGTLYTSNDVAPTPLAPGLVAIQPDGSWKQLTDVWGTNGLVIDPTGTTMYAAVTFDQRSPIARIPLSDPDSYDTDIQLTFGVASLQPAVYPEDNDPDAPLLGVKGLDDLTRDDDGTLYVVANGTGELLRVDPTTGEACLLAGGLQNPSSVRIAPKASGFDDGNPASLEFFITEFSGAIKIVIVHP